MSLISKLFKKYISLSFQRDVSVSNKRKIYNCLFKDKNTLKIQKIRKFNEILRGSDDFFRF